MEDKVYFNDLAYKWDDMCNHPKEKTRYVISKVGIERGENVLDLGSGTGVTIPFIEEKIGEKGKITAIDFAENMIAISKKKFYGVYKNIEYRIIDFYDYENDNLFDCIIAYSCYPHFKDKSAFFKKCMKLLKKNGKLIIAHIESKEIINGRHKKIEENIISERLLPIKEMEKYIEKLGIEVIYSEDNEQFYILVCKKNKF